MRASRRGKLLLGIVAGAVLLALVANALRPSPSEVGEARARHDIAHGQAKYYYVSGVVNAPPPASAKEYESRGVSLISTGCLALDTEQAAYNEAVAAHYRR